MSRWKLAVCCLSFALSGCSMWDTWDRFIGNNQTEPDPDASKWADVGKEARHGYPREEADWFERHIWSDKAREINRSLGYD